MFRNPQLTDYQQAVINSPYPNKFLVWGRQAGATLVLIKLVERAALVEECFYLVPNYPMLRNAANYLRMKGSFNRSIGTFTPKVGHPIRFMTYDYFLRYQQGIDFLTPRTFALDAAHLSPESFWGEVSIFRPTSRMLVAGTPMHQDAWNQNHWFRYAYAEALSRNDWDTFPASRPPYIAESQYEQFRREMPEAIFRTQILGEWWSNDET